MAATSARSRDRRAQRIPRHTARLWCDQHRQPQLVGYRRAVRLLEAVAADREQIVSLRVDRETLRIGECVNSECWPPELMQTEA